MIINVALTEKSIKQAIAELERVKKDTLPLLVKEILGFLCDFFIKRANEHLDRSTVGANVKEGIKSAWKPSLAGSVLTITNDDDKAVFVEFGVGIRAKQSGQHPNAQNQDGKPYQYDIGGHPLGIWGFKIDDLADLDLPSGKASYEATELKDGGYSIGTRGAVGAMYAYNALMDIRDDLQNPNGIIQREWQRIKERLIK